MWSCGSRPITENLISDVGNTIFFTEGTKDKEVGEVAPETPTLLLCLSNAPSAYSFRLDGKKKNSRALNSRGHVPYV